MHWTDDLTKAQKRELRRIAGVVYERELSAALNDFAAVAAVEKGIVRQDEVAADLLEIIRPRFAAHSEP